MFIVVRKYRYILLYWWGSSTLRTSYEHNVHCCSHISTKDTSKRRKLEGGGFLGMSYKYLYSYKCGHNSKSRESFRVLEYHLQCSCLTVFVVQCETDISRQDAVKRKHVWLSRQITPEWNNLAHMENPLSSHQHTSNQ